MQVSWLSNKADEIQGYGDRKNMDNFYAGLKEIYVLTASRSPPLLSADGSNPIKDKEKILIIWAEHFDSVLNRPFVINNEAIKRLPQVPVNETMNAMPTFDEIQKATRQLSSGKAPGTDSIPADIYKEDVRALTGKITSSSN